MRTTTKQQLGEQTIRGTGARQEHYIHNSTRTRTRRRANNGGLLEQRRESLLLSAGPGPLQSPHGPTSTARARDRAPVLGVFDIVKIGSQSCARSLPSRSPAVNLPSLAPTRRDSTRLVGSPPFPHRRKSGHDIATPPLPREGSFGRIRSHTTRTPQCLSSTSHTCAHICKMPPRHASA
jgi:hypothetical protein